MDRKLKFALIGAAGFVAPRHLKAIADVGGDLVTAYDPSDSVGILDSHFPDCAFYTDFERFTGQIADSRANGDQIDYVSICSPNYLHDPHIRAGLRAGADVICEKPLVTDPSVLDDLVAIEKETGKSVSSILQLRLHPSVIALRDRIEADTSGKIYDVDLSYITSRGNWYHESWKGDPRRSGGIAMNIGVHFYDMLIHIFGAVKNSVVHERTADMAAGSLELERAHVRWMLSINRNHLPRQTPAGQRTYRSITVDGDEFEFSGGFTDLHTDSYKAIINGARFGIDTVRPSIGLVADIMKADIVPRTDTGEHAKTAACG